MGQRSVDDIIVTQLVRKLPALCRIQRFIPMFIRDLTRPYPVSDVSSLHAYTLLS
jgi:hypothetical protein